MLMPQRVNSTWTSPHVSRYAGRSPGRRGTRRGPCGPVALLSSCSPVRRRVFAAASGPTAAHDRAQQAAQTRKRAAMTSAFVAALERAFNHTKMKLLRLNALQLLLTKCIQYCEQNELNTLRRPKTLICRRLLSIMEHGSLDARRVLRMSS